MAKDPQDTPQDDGAVATATAEKPERKASKFRIVVRPKGQTDWTMLDEQYESITQDDAKRKAARALLEHGVYGPLIQTEGIELAAVSARGFKPIVVKVEPQAPKLTFGS